MMMFITYANISGEIYIICCSFEMEEKSSASAEFHSQRFTSANICAPPRANAGHLDKIRTSLWGLPWLRLLC